MTHAAPAAIKSDVEIFRSAVLEGLCASPVSIPGKYLWDARGSEIFDAITRDASYYPVTSELSVLDRAIDEIVPTVGAEASIVEFGSGACHKVRRLLDRLDRPHRYITLDISFEFLKIAAARISHDYPGVDVIPLRADYTARLPEMPLSGGPTLGYFPGTTIGNMHPDEAVALMSRMRSALGPSRLLIGQDPCDRAADLTAAYGSPLMAAFHENLLRRLERELGAVIRPDGALRHGIRIRHDPALVEAHLIATETATISIGARSFTIEAGHSIRTDMSWKHAPDAFTRMAQAAGWRVERSWPADDGRFCLFLLVNPIP